MTHLRALVKYWTRRHRVDARDEMELVFATQGRSRFTIPKLGKEEAPEGRLFGDLRTKLILNIPSVFSAAIMANGASPYLAKVQHTIKQTFTVELTCICSFGIGVC